MPMSERDKVLPVRKDDMKIISGKEQEYETWYDKSPDRDSRSCFRFAERWAELLEMKIDEVGDINKAIADNVDKMGYLADIEGITGIAYMWAVNILSLYWKYGEELRKWYDKKYGNKGNDVCESNDSESERGTLMREKFKYAGQILKVKQGVGNSSFGQNMSGQDFVAEDWCENVLGKSWMFANGNPAALEYAVRASMFGPNNGVSAFSDDVVYGKIGDLGHLFHVNELEVPDEL